MNAHLDVVLACADSATRQRALRVHDRLVDELGEEYLLGFTWWPFTLLKSPSRFEHAVRTAADADLIIVAAASGASLPKAVESWIAAWRVAKRNRVRQSPSTSPSCGAGIPPHPIDNQMPERSNEAASHGHACRNAAAQDAAWTNGESMPFLAHPFGLSPFALYQEHAQQIAQSDAPPGIPTLLSAAAREDKGLEFFPHTFPLLEETPCCLADMPHHIVAQLRPMLEDVLTDDHSTRYWGIND